MSLPRQTLSHSSSPSKPSLRRGSGPQTLTTRTPTLLPSPHFHDDHLATSQAEESASYDEHAVAVSTQNAPPNFQPFFTLIEDPITHEHYHPTVHYIFADDEADIITEAACRSLEEAPDNESQAIASGSSKDGDNRYLPPPVAGVKEHYLVIDVQPTLPPSSQGDLPVAAPGYAVTHSTSLSPDWQVLRTNLTQAPTIGDRPEDEGLMLRVEGRGNTPPDTVASTENQILEEMIERFQRRLEDVRLVMEGASNKAEKEG